MATGVVFLLALIVAAAALLNTEPRRSGTSSVPATTFVTDIGASQGALCGRGAPIPPRTAGVRVMLGTYSSTVGRVDVTVSDRSGRVLRRSQVRDVSDGERPIWRFAEFAGGLPGAEICFQTRSPKVAVAGTPNGNVDPATRWFTGKRDTPGDIAIDYLRPGEESTAGMLGTIFRRASLLRPEWVGPWTFWLVFLIGLSVIGWAAWLLLSLSSRRAAVHPHRRWLIAVAAIAFANAALWATISPIFNVPDEFAHYAYVETVARGELPPKSTAGVGNSYLPSSVLLSRFTTDHVIQSAEGKPPWGAGADRDFRDAYERLRGSPQDKRYGVTPANGYSPLYYAPAVVPYGIGELTGDGLTQVWLVRLYSALFAALTALFTYLFARELAPGVTWFAPVAALAVAFEPMVLHLGGGVTNDNAVIAFGSLVLYLLARLLRQGVTTQTAVLTGAAFALGVAAKPPLISFAPALLLTAVVLVLRARPLWRPVALRLAYGGAAAAALLALGFALFGLSSSDAGELAEGADDGAKPTLAGLLSFTWQWYLPRLPFMEDFHTGEPPVASVFVRGFLGNFNHLDTQYPGWVYVLAGVVAAVLLAAALRALYVRRDALRDRWPLVAVPLAAAASLALFVNLVTYLVLVRDEQPFAQGRYLLPAVAVFGAFVAGGSLGFGRRHGLAVGTAAVLALAFLNIFGMGISLARFYT